MNKKYINKYSITAIVFSIVLLLIIKDICISKEIFYDKVAIDIAKNIRSHEMTLFMTIVTGFGSFIFFTLAFIVLFILYKNKKTILYLLINTIAIFLTNDFVKHIFQRSRPSGTSLVKEASYSFPSSHVMVSVLFYGLLIYIINKKIKDIKIKYTLITILVLLIILIGISRVYLGVHYLSDVIGGLSFGIIYLMIFLMLNKDFEEKV